MPREKADSPIVEAVREARRQIAKDSEYDLPKMLGRLRQDEQASGRPTRIPHDSKVRGKD